MKIFTSDLHTKVIKLIAQYGYITVEEAVIITNDKSKAYQVLKYLHRKGNLHTLSTHLHPTQAYYLPENMRRIIESSGQVNHVEEFFPSSYRPTNFYHHMSLIKVHLTFEKVLGDRLIEYLPETQLKRDSGRQNKICDGEFIFKNNKGERKRAGVEIELTLKNTEARHKSIKNLFAHALINLDVIIIFYNHEVIRQLITKTIKERNESGVPVYFIGLNDFLEKGAEAEAQTPDGERLQIFKYSDYD